MHQNNGYKDIILFFKFQIKSKPFPNLIRLMLPIILWQRLTIFQFCVIVEYPIFSVKSYFLILPSILYPKVYKLYFKFNHNQTARCLISSLSDLRTFTPMRYVFSETPAIPESILSVVGLRSFVEIACGKFSVSDFW